MDKINHPLYDALHAKFCKYYESQSTNFSQSVTVSDVHVKEPLR